MKILLVGNSIHDEQLSMLAFARVMHDELVARGHEVRLVHPPTVVGAWAPRSRLNKWLRYVDKFLVYPPRLRREAAWADIVHVCDHSNSMYINPVRGRPNLITCHDVIAIQAAEGMIEGWHVSATGRLFQRLIKRGLGRADAVACISQKTREDLLALNIAESERTALIANGLNADFHPVPGDAAFATLAGLGIGRGDDFLLHVGTDLPRKNRFTVLRAFAELARSESARLHWPHLKLVLVGPALNDEMQAYAAEHRLLDRILVLGGLNVEQLRCVYSTAVALVFPSTSEGFGWPIIEAQACGCPVLVSDLAPMNQIGGEAALPIDPFDHKGIANTLLAHAARLSEVAARGIANAAKYTKAGMIDSYEALYRRVLEQAR